MQHVEATWQKDLAEQIKTTIENSNNLSAYIDPSKPATVYILGDPQQGVSVDVIHNSGGTNPYIKPSLEATEHFNDKKAWLFIPDENFNGSIELDYTISIVMVPNCLQPRRLRY